MNADHYLQLEADRVRRNETKFKQDLVTRIDSLEQKIDRLIELLDKPKKAKAE